MFYNCQFLFPLLIFSFSFFRENNHLSKCNSSSLNSPAQKGEPTCQTQKGKRKMKEQKEQKEQFSRLLHSFFTRELLDYQVIKFKIPAFLKASL